MSFPNSTRIYVGGQLHPDLRVPMREISLSDTNRPDGRSEPNDPVRVYDCSGPWGDPAFDRRRRPTACPPCAATGSSPAATSRNTTAAPSKPEDNGYLSDEHAAASTKTRPPKTSSANSPASTRRPPPAAARQPAHPVTQLHYARQGIITPEMEFIAIRENLGRRSASRLCTT